VRRAGRGIAVTMEAVLASIMIALVVALAFMYAVSSMPARTTVSNTVIDARLCGYVLTVKNVGSETALNLSVYDETGMEVSFSDRSKWKTSLQPGEAATAVLQYSYSRVVVVGDNVASTVVVNECRRQ